MNNLSLALLNETWLFKGDTLSAERFRKLEDEHDLVMIRKDRINQRGGGVAVCYDKKKGEFKKIQQTNISRDNETLACIGTILGIKKKVLVISSYFKPNLGKRKAEEFASEIIDTISTFKATHPDGFIILGGDWNSFDVGFFTDLMPDLKIVLTGPTRKGRTLDIILTNYASMICESLTSHPFQSDDGETQSDHDNVIAKAKLPRHAPFVWQKEIFYRIDSKGSINFREKLKNIDWNQQLINDPNKDAIVFQICLQNAVHSCFRRVTVRRKSNENPWVTPELNRLMKRRMAIFNKEARSEAWKKIDKEIKISLKTKRRQFYEKRLHLLQQSGNSGKWFKIYKGLDAKNEDWSVRDIDPEMESSTLADNLAEHFSKITDTNEPLGSREKLSFEIPTEYLLQESNVRDRLQKYKKPSSQVPGDIHKTLATQNADLIATPLTMIYNQCIRKAVWPEVWKREYITPIPKTRKPSSMEEIRPISMTTLWSKIFESFVYDVSIKEIGGNLRSNQHGGRKGCSTNHIIIKFLDTIMRSLEKKTTKAVVLTCIDFSKSFSRCSIPEILRSYESLGASPWLIEMHAAFLSGRTMKVKVGLTYSTERPVKGGAVQGSILGVLDHNVVLESLDLGIEDEKLYIEKYIDDMTIIETVDREIPCVIDNSGVRPIHLFKPQKTQSALQTIVDRAEARGLKINDKKTQMISISSAHYDSNAWLTTSQGEIIHSQKELKLLGFVFSNKATMDNHISYIIRKAGKRLCAIKKFAMEGFPKKDIINLFTSLVRSILEYSVPSFHSLTNLTNSARIERIQNTVLRWLYGDIPKSERLKQAGLISLHDRREKLLFNFATKTQKNPLYTSWFPIKEEQRRSERINDIYVEELATTNRLKNTPIFRMRALLNENTEPLEPDCDLAYLFM